MPLDTVVYLSGTTRGATLEHIGRSLAPTFQALGFTFIEVSLLDHAAFLRSMQTIDFTRVALVFSWVSMGMEIQMRRPDGSSCNPWQEMGVPFLSFHGDSPAYFFDRHVVRNSRFISLYGFTEHAELRRRLPSLQGPVETIWPAVLDPMPQADIDFKAKQSGKLLFLKNGKNPSFHPRFWASVLETRLLRWMLELADLLTADMDGPAGCQIDDAVSQYFHERSYDLESHWKLRLFFIAQLDDYLRAVKSTRVAEALLEFPVEIRGNEWHHLDFTGKRAQWIDRCDYAESIGLIRGALGLIDMSPNTRSRPHDRVMRAYGAHTLCLTNQQDFLSQLPHAQQTSFSFDKAALQQKVSDLLAHPADTVAMGREIADAYRSLHPAESLVEKMLDSAALARLNHATERPAGMQDFVVWPPRSV